MVSGKWSKGACGATRQGFRGTYIAWDWIEGDLYLMSREKTSIVVEGKAQSCDCRVREEDCVTLALQSETWEKKEVLGQRFKIISGGRYLHGTGVMSLEGSRTALEG